MVDNLYIDNIFSLYEIVESKYFDNQNEKFLKNDQLKSNFIGVEKQKEIKNHFNNTNLLIKEDILIEAIKKYFLRYCLGDYEKEVDILKNMNIDKIFRKSDIWDKNIFKNIKFEEESKALIRLNNGDKKFIEKYFFSIIFNLKDEAKTIFDNDDNKFDDDDVEKKPDDSGDEESGDENKEEPRRINQESFI